MGERVAVTKDYPVRVALKGEGSDTEISLAETVHRVAMHPVDEIVAYRAMAEEGMEVENIAARFGQSVVTVRQRLKLASLSPRILDVLRANEISSAQAKALAISDDHAAQEQAWFEQPSWNHDPHSLRSFLTQAHVRATDRLVRFVGIDAYEQAGGTVLRDLFGKDTTTHLTDRVLLVKLATGQLETLADEVRQRGWRWVEISLEANAGYGAGHDRIRPTSRALSEAEQAELDALGEEFDTLAERTETYEDEDAPDLAADEQRQQMVSDRMEAIQTRATSYDPQEMALAGCIIGIAHNGGLDLTQGLVKPEDQKALAALRNPEGQPGEGEGSEGAEEPAEPEASGLPASLVEELTAIRTAAMRVELVGRPQVALAAILMPLVSRAFYGYAMRAGLDTAVEVRGEFRDLAPSIKEPDACRALSCWKDVMETWGSHIPGAPADLAVAAGAGNDRLLDLLAVVTAANLNAVSARHDASKSRSAQAGQVAEAVELDMNAWWLPEAPFLSRLSKADIAGVLREARCGETAAKAAKRSPKDDAVALAEEELAETGWLPMPLRGPEKPAGVDTALAVAAE